ncbi:tetratricopeptide repeat protein [Psychroflexus sp. CAK57W]|uniref:adenylate/guanylate cyclase domain-containing protein n=1 Tax=Psychroflexus curvus TaxID=2873595 RepID=UPI001CCFE3E3|nr:adenylate/guanylate cyclase domain-containing protein [Psychroflexus curvus]MBZ9786411.1 tetratricopeptide repeat protein [Psychroflexus curvus]
MNIKSKIAVEFIASFVQKAFILGFFFIGTVYSQNNPSDLDSLEHIYMTGAFEQNDELYLLSEIVNKQEDLTEILKYSDLLIEKATKADSPQYLFTANLQKGNVYLNKSELSKALEYYQTAAKLASEAEENDRLALTNITIGGVYSDIGNYSISIDYYEEGISQLRDLIKITTLKTDLDKFEKYLAGALLNAGDVYIKTGDLEKALGYFYESSGLCKKTDYRLGSAYNLGNIGMVYAKQNKPKMAEANLQEAIKILEQEKDYYPISVYLNYISGIYVDLGQLELAKDYARRSLEIAKTYDLKNQRSEANLRLAKIYEKTNELSESLFHFKNYISTKDSINNIATIQKLANQRTAFEVSQKQSELDFEIQKRKNDKILTYGFLGGMILVSGLAFGLYRRTKFISKTNKLIDEEKKRSDNLLLNILPRDTADELKKSGKVVAKKYESVTVLFTDFEGFTKYAENSPPEKLVESVDLYFSEFDKIMEKYKLEKIKTIGDAYMCAAGLPEQTENHAELMAQAALDIIDFVKKSKQVHAVSDLRFNVRVGMHTGSVVAGVVGKNKFSYDIWGDTVNVASRIESSCEPGKISVSEDTYKLIKDYYRFEDRGEISIKNRSPLKMYYLYKK